MTFPECVVYCAGVPEFVAQFNRLSGRHLGQSLKRSAFDKLIDDAVGFKGERDEDMAAFAAFVWECVWERLPPEAFQEMLEGEPAQ